MLVAARGQEQEPASIVVPDPVADGERRSFVGEQFQGTDVGGEHGADGERSLGVGEIDDGLRHGALHGLGESVEAGLEQVLDQDRLRVSLRFQNTAAP